MEMGRPRLWGFMVTFSLIGFLFFNPTLAHPFADHEYVPLKLDWAERDHHHYEGHQQDLPREFKLGGKCRLPESWKGNWFQSGVPTKILIDEKSIGSKGECYDSAGDKFLFLDSTNCRRCVVINERHPNILQYKESPFCEDRDSSLENLCSQIGGDAQLYSLFRIDASPEDCPFKGAPFTFTYNRGYGDCKNPVSHVDSCSDPSKLLFKYQACPDVLKTESTEEELECLGNWREGSYQYLVGRIHHRLSTPSSEDAFRCFVFEKMKSRDSTGVIGYKVAQSGDATCSGVSNPTEGAKTLILQKAESTGPRCKFPSWLSSAHWHSLDGHMSVKLHHKNMTIHVGENPSDRRELRFPSSSLRKTYFNGGTRMACLSRSDVSDRHTSILVYHSDGCKHQRVCLQLFKRDRHVVEIQVRAVPLGPASLESGDFECGSGIEANDSFETLVTSVSASDLTSSRCPYLGKYSATGLTQEGREPRDVCGGSNGAAELNSLVVGCGDRATMEFPSMCTTSQPVTSYLCHGSWEEEGKGFLIASPVSRTSTGPRRFCFIYSQTDTGLRVSASSHTCHRNFSPGLQGSWAFNLTVDGRCAEAMTAGAGNLFKWDERILTLFVILLLKKLASFYCLTV